MAKRKYQPVRVAKKDFRSNTATHRVNVSAPKRGGYRM